MQNKISTMDNYIRQGNMGPIFCVLCLRGEESIFHLALECSFTKVVWDEIEKVYKITHVWDENDRVYCYNQWLEHVYDWKELPIFISWGLWRHHARLVIKSRIT